MALWDILGKAAGLPLYKLLGGAVREFVPTKYSVSGLGPASAAEIAVWAVEQGFSRDEGQGRDRAGGGPGPGAGGARGGRAGGAPGGGRQRRLGAAGGDPNPALEEFDVFFVEQPVAPLDVAWLADVRAHARVPIMADESVATPQDALALIRAGAADVLSLYLGKGGGIGPARTVAAVAEAAGLACTIGSNLELGIGNAAMIHLALATPAIAAGGVPVRHPQPLLLRGRPPGRAPAHRGGPGAPVRAPRAGRGAGPGQGAALPRGVLMTPHVAP